MNKKRIEKIITHNIESKGDFNRIKDKINIKIYKKERISFKEFILSRRVLRLVCPLLALAISLPFLPKFLASNNKNSSAQVNIETSNEESSKIEISNNDYSTECESNATNSSIVAELSSSSSQCTFYLSTIDVYGVIVLNEGRKMFYTDEVYGYYNELNKDKEFRYTGFYEIEHLYNYESLNVDDYCVAYIVVNKGNSEFEVNDIYEIRIIEE